MSRTKRFLFNLLLIGGFWIFPLLLYAPVTLGGQTMLPLDNLYQWAPWSAYAEQFGVSVPDNGLLSDQILENYVWKQYVRETLAKGDIPLWNPHLFAGAPFLANGQHSMYYPFSWLFLLLPLTAAYGWYTASQIWLAGWFTYAFGRALGQRRAAAFVAGLIFQGCGFMVVSAAVFPMIIGAAVWLPLILCCLEMVIRATTSEKGAGLTYPWAALGSFALGLQILAGHIEITYYTLLIMALFSLWRILSRVTAEKWRRSVGLGRHSLFSRVIALRIIKPFLWLTATVALGLMMGAIQFVPFYEVGIANFREGSASLAEVQGWAFPTRRVLTLVLPDFFGNPADHSYTDAWTGEQIPFALNTAGQLNPHGPYTSNWGIKNYVEGGIYLSILALVLAGFGVVGVRHKPNPAVPQHFGSRRSAVGFLVTLSFFSLSFIFGTPFYAILYYGLPGINQLHSPFRWVFPLSLAVALLAGFGMDYLAQVRREVEIENSAQHPTKWYSPLAIITLWGEKIAITAAAGVLFWAGIGGVLLLYLSKWFFANLEPTFNQIFLNLALAPDAFSHVQAFYSYQFTNVWLFCLMLVNAGVVLRVSRCPIFLPEKLFNFLKPEGSQDKQPLWPFLAAVAIGLDLWVVGFGFNAMTDPQLLTFQPQLIQWLQEQPELELGRVTTFDNKGQKPLNANTPWLVGLNDIRGYDSVILKQYVQYMGLIEPQNELPYNRIQPIGQVEALNSPLLDLLGVHFIITHETLDLPKLQLAWEGEGVKVYRNTAVLPRAYTLPHTAKVFVPDLPTAHLAMQQSDPRYYAIIDIEHLNLQFDQRLTPDDPGIVLNQLPPLAGEPQPAVITSYGNREVLIEATVAERSWLILTDSYFPGWRAYVRPAGAAENEEKEVDIVRVNGLFRAVLLEEGAWTVRFRYSPPTFWVGGLASVMAGIILFFALVVWLWRRFYHPQGDLTNTRSIAKNSVAPMALSLFNRGIDFLFAAFYLRLLGPADAGAYATAIAIAGLYEILANFGLNAFLIREVSQHKDKASGYLFNTTLLRLVTGVVGSWPVLLYVWSAGLTPSTTQAVIFFMVGMVLSGMGLGFTGLFYAFEEAEIPAAVTTMTTILKVGLGVIVLLLGYGFVGLAAASIGVNLITLTILAVLAGRRYPLCGPWVVDGALQRQMLRQSYPLMLNHLLATVYWQVDVLILQQINGEEVVGWYNSAYKYVNALNVIPSFFTFALFPIISRQVRSNLDDARRTFRMSIKLLTLVSLPLAATVTFLAPTLITLLGGEQFLPHGYIALQIIIWSIPVGWLNSVTNYVLISLGQERLQTGAFIIGVTFNLVGNLLLLPYLSYVGAGLTTIASEIILLLIFNYYLEQKMPGVGWWRLLWRPGLVAAGMLAVMAAVQPFNLWLALFLGLWVYPAGLIALRVFGAEEKRILAALIPQKIQTRFHLQNWLAS